MDDEEPTVSEIQAWRSLRRIVGRVGTALTRELTESCDISGSEFIVLTCLERLGRGTLRQAVLADKMELNKSQVSHLVSRMESRGLVVRHRVGNKGTNVVITDQGRSIQLLGQPTYNRAIRRNFLEKLSPENVDAILLIAAQFDLIPPAIEPLKKPLTTR